MIWRVNVRARAGRVDGQGRTAFTALRNAGLSSVDEVRSFRVTLIDADWDEASATRMARALLVDPVIEECSVFSAAETPEVPRGHSAVLLFKKPGVTDPVEQSAIKAISDLGAEAERVRCGTLYHVRGRIGEEELRKAVLSTLANEAVDEIRIGERSFESISVGAPCAFELKRIDLLEADDDELKLINESMQLSLTRKELHVIREYFRKEKRDPTDVELETIAQTWSEHCRHKTFTGDVRYGSTMISNLLKSTIMKATRELNRSWCVSVFKDNAGIISFDDEHDVCFKVETHNHPSAIDPYGGANTGIGGVIRDILGCGMGARPVCSTNVFCVGDPETAPEDLPPGTIHPRRILEGVVAGVRDYGNRMGIPTVNGAVLFDERYIGNPLVYAGTVGILPKGMSEKEPREGDLVVLLGGRTGRDGIHGATFSSTGLHDRSEELSSGAVQIGNAIVEKRVLDLILQARDRNLYTSITDCGAGGLSSAVGEMGEELGAEIDLEKVPLKYEGLTYAEIWISEAQERMVLSVPPSHENALRKLCEGENVEMSVIGKFTGDGGLHLRYDGTTVGKLSMEFLHDGLPRWITTASYSPSRGVEPDLPEKKSYNDDLLGVLRRWNVCSKEWVVRQYDHEVQGGSVVKPFVGALDDGPGDAAVIRPVLGNDRGLAIGCGICPPYSDLSAYDMAACAIDEAIRNVIAVGGDPARVALLDNFSWGSPDDAENMGALMKASEACYDIAVAYGAPFISGKDSLHNEYRVGEKRIVIPHTLLISAISIVKDVRKCVTMDAKSPGNVIYLVGQTRDELGGSQYYARLGHRGANVPRVDASIGKKIFKAVAGAIREGLVRSCHDLSEGGLAVAAAEMAFAGSLGMRLDLENVPRSADLARDDTLLFSETPSRFLLEVRGRDIDHFEERMAGVLIAHVGELVPGKNFVVQGTKGKRVIELALAEMKEAWQEPLRW